MAYEELIADRVRLSLHRSATEFTELKMMGGLCFQVQGKMLCGLHFDKKMNQHLLMARIGEEAYVSEVEKDECLPMDFTGRPMRGYLFVIESGFDNDPSLDYWLQKCLEFNPLAKASVKKRRKTSLADFLHVESKRRTAQTFIGIGQYRNAIRKIQGAFVVRFARALFGLVQRARVPCW